MKHTDRYAMVECPKCSGQGGESEIAYNGLGYTEDEEWVDCGECEGVGTTARIRRLAWLIGEARESER